MVTKGTAKFIGRRTGQGNRGPWYMVSLVTEGEPITLRCSPHVYDQCGSFEFGEEIDFLLESRLFDRQWVLSISSLGE